MALIAKSWTKRLLPGKNGMLFFREAGHGFGGADYEFTLTSSGVRAKNGHVQALHLEDLFNTLRLIACPKFFTLFSETLCAGVLRENEVWFFSTSRGSLCCYNVLTGEQVHKEPPAFTKSERATWIDDPPDGVLPWPYAPSLSDGGLLDLDRMAGPHWLG